MTTSDAIIIIPARYASSRFPGKPLVELSGRKSILRTLDAARAVVDNAQIYLATDDQRIAELVAGEGGQVVMTSEACRNGTERVAEAAVQLGLADDQLVVNLQGDAPLTPPWFISAVIAQIQRLPAANMVTPVLPCDEASYRRFREDRLNGRVGATTCVMSTSGRAIYFSKEVVPFLSDADELAENQVFHHVGLYAYRVGALKKYTGWPLGPIERAEGLEQLRFIENDLDVHTVIVQDRGHQFWELNNPEDVAVIERMIRENEALSSEA